MSQIRGTRRTVFVARLLSVLPTTGLLAGCGGLGASYEAEAARLRALEPGIEPHILDEAALAHLPDPVQRYVRRSGHVGRPLVTHAEIDWETSAIRKSADADWMELRTRQINAVAGPARLAFMRTRLFGVVPFEGKDSYLDGAGSMRMVLMKGITLGHDRGPEMDQSALVTLLAEAFLLPACVLAPYVEWEAIDARSARATIRHDGAEASGVFEFDEAGDMVRFHTRERYFAEGGGRFRLVPWSAEVDDHVRDADGLRWPRTMRGVWHTEDGAYVYFRGTVAGIRYGRAGGRVDPAPTTKRSP